MLCVSAVSVFCANIHRRGAEYAEARAEKTSKTGLQQQLKFVGQLLIHAAGHEPAVYGEDLTVDESRRLGGQKDRRADQLFELAEALERCAQ